MRIFSPLLGWALFCVRKWSICMLPSSAHTSAAHPTTTVAEWSGPRSITIPELTLDSGEQLAPVTIAYETWGTLHSTHDNAVLVCHALTGDAHAADLAASDAPRAGWWNPLIGPGRVFDTERHFIICTNVLGSCYGSSGPTSAHPADGQPYRLRFPQVTIGDMVRAQAALVAALGITRLVAVAGGSIGGLQALEWAIAYPAAMERAIIIAASPRLGALGLAIDDIARQAVMGDARWDGGDYLPEQGPAVGLGIARMLNMLTYTTAEDLDVRFGRTPASQPNRWPTFGPGLAVETYMHHQADKLIRRFDANAYLYLTSAMDRYDAAAGRGNDAEAFARIRARVLTVGVDSDWLYPARDVGAMAAGIREAGGDATYVELASRHGHDAFLKDWAQFDRVLRPFTARS
jgi:homoserine O-acetyltransferase/O-succinyltransferase